MRSIALIETLTLGHSEASLCAAILDIYGTVVGLGSLYSVAVYLDSVISNISCCSLRVDIDNAETALGQSVDKLELGARHTLHRAEGLEMHLAYRGDDAYLGRYEVANLLDIATLLSTHLYDEYLVVRLQMFTYRAHHAKRSVEVSRGHKHVVPLREETVEEVLSRGLTEAARYAYNPKVGHCSKHTLSIVVVPACDSPLHRANNRTSNYRPVVYREEHHSH